jgi:glycerol-3-phosphate acyltransferase PlsX
MVCDGFVGNVVLKLTEGMASSIFSLLKESLMADTRSKIGALMLKPQLSNMKKRLDYREYGGAPLLGTVKPVVKAHGSSDYYAFKNGIGQLKTFIERDVIGTIENKIGI